MNINVFIIILKNKIFFVCQNCLNGKNKEDKNKRIRRNYGKRKLILSIFNPIKKKKILCYLNKLT